MNKKIIALAVAAAVSAPAAFAADVTVYGKLRQSIDFIDAKADNDNPISKEIDNVKITDKASRIGVKGSEDLGNGLKGLFQMEWDVEISESNDGPDGNEFKAGEQFSGRNAFIGLAGDFGTVILGRHDHPLKMSTGWADIFGDTIADNASFQAEGYSYQDMDLRANGTLAYVSPNLSGLTLIAALVPGENNSADGMADAYSLAGIYKNAGLTVSLAYEEGDADIDALGGPGASSPDYEQTRFGIGYTMDAFHVNYVYTDQELIDDTETTFDSHKIAGKYTMGNNVIKAQWWTRDGDDDHDIDGWAIGLEHNLSKRTQAQIVYSDVDDEGDDWYKATDSTAARVSGDVFSIQLNHNF